MRTHYIYLEDKIVDEIPAKSREQARKLFIEKYKEINGDSEVPKVVVTVRKRQTKKRSTFHVSPDIYNLIERHRSEDNISISQYIGTVIDELISGKYDYAFDFEKLKNYAGRRNVNFARLLEEFYSEELGVGNEYKRETYAKLSHKLSQALKEVTEVKAELDAKLEEVKKYQTERKNNMKNQVEFDEQKEFEKARKRYNKIMNELSYEHLTVHEELSEGTEKYTIADMVNEVETLLASFFENGHVNDEWRKEEPKRVNAYIARLKRFIDKYKENSDKFSKDK
ncbi:hypothetical protein HMPREF9525_01953 [Enterococcus faecium TX0133a04]|uniref:hypothetical protein n=1 Tax=Enterococcus faecium TaxID=1352 RepID=UPI0001EB7204|nr:hypothetical protein [Enterococcus faecium]EFR67888.1 hypothetical protein HMPREF9524_01970 [Enterococcus faecium TX0133a01]EFR70301.1 hypothetical protein HMPREF9526_02684 [Enterococcus faecium TX0133B]EFR74062.1 hypothetical protein HMPREF9523_02029 [Enterococcus faecium TX0133A]EFR79138.1 hypothetical protein HMPREF9527_00032 [Enterococcus faecium TX0133C]EFS05950.1 hypothetical protein HMPREF9525_01953 [Enterococcus faecium TX0133a04]